MSDHGTHHHDADHSSEIKSKTAFKSSFWFVIILVGLFIAALNFIKDASHEEGHEGKEGHTEQHDAKEGHDTHSAEAVTGHEEEHDTAAAAHHMEAAAVDTAGHETHH